MAKSKLVKANEKVAEKVVGGYKAIENAVVSGYKKIEDGFVVRYLTRDGESVEDAKARIHADQEKHQTGKHETSDGSDYVKLAQEHAKEHVRMAQETAHMSKKSN